MTRHEADIEINEILDMSTDEFERKYNSDSKREVIAEIELLIDHHHTDTDEYNYNGFISAYACNSYLY
ncbi:hypothetical protein D0T49_10640 [Paludibacter sp. 221]|uniref:hypothetical protein n=1 Tax=Paludibacter sp. 221 TaxID=2302939 RepID=UPI0013D76BE0|nr:hypothetical protein [Paludibacter sp. 221]NDV47503.1 hypothetical protein [Paludibacter sp. 221]